MAPAPPPPPHRLYSSRVNLPPHASPKMYLLLTLSLASCMTSLSIAKPSSVRGSIEELIVSLIGISIILSTLTYCALCWGPSLTWLVQPLVLKCSGRSDGDGCKIEIKSRICALVILFLALSAMTGALVMFVGNEIGVAGQVEVWSSNLYFGTWATFLGTSYLFADGCVAPSYDNVLVSSSALLPPIDHTLRVRDEISRTWILICVHSLILFASNASLLTGSICGGDATPLQLSTRESTRMAIGVVIGGVGMLLPTLHWCCTYFREAHFHRRAPTSSRAEQQLLRRFDQVSCILGALCILCFAVNAVLLTSSVIGDGEPCNVYYSSWICFGLSLYLALRHVDVWLPQPFVKREAFALRVDRQVSKIQCLPKNGTVTSKRRSGTGTGLHGFERDEEDGAEEPIVARRKCSDKSGRPTMSNDELTPAEVRHDPIQRHPSATQTDLCVRLSSCKRAAPGLRSPTTKKMPKRPDPEAKAFQGQPFQSKACARQNMDPSPAQFASSQRRQHEHWPSSRAAQRSIEEPEEAPRPQQEKPMAPSFQRPGHYGLEKLQHARLPASPPPRNADRPTDKLGSSCPSKKNLEPEDTFKASSGSRQHLSRNRKAAFVSPSEADASVWTVGSVLPPKRTKPSSARPDSKKLEPEESSKSSVDSVGSILPPKPKTSQTLNHHGPSTAPKHKPCPNYTPPPPRRLQTVESGKSIDSFTSQPRTESLQREEDELLQQVTASSIHDLERRSASRRESLWEDPIEKETAHPQVKRQLKPCPPQRAASQLGPRPRVVPRAQPEVIGLVRCNSERSHLRPHVPAVEEPSKSSSSYIETGCDTPMTLWAGGRNGNSSSSLSSSLRISEHSSGLSIDPWGCGQQKSHPKKEHSGEKDAFVISHESIPALGRSTGSRSSATKPPLRIYTRNAGSNRRRGYTRVDPVSAKSTRSKGLSSASSMTVVTRVRSDMVESVTTSSGSSNASVDPPTVPSQGANRREHTTRWSRRASTDPDGELVRARSAVIAWSEQQSMLGELKKQSAPTSGHASLRKEQLNLSDTLQAKREDGVPSASSGGKHQQGSSFRSPKTMIAESAFSVSGQGGKAMLDNAKPTVDQIVVAALKQEQELRQIHIALRSALHSTPSEPSNQEEQATRESGLRSFRTKSSSDENKTSPTDSAQTCKTNATMAIVDAMVIEALKHAKEAKGNNRHVGVSATGNSPNRSHNSRTDQDEVMKC